MKYLIAILLSVLVFFGLKAQQYGKSAVHEIGIEIGTANYLGDLGATGDLWFFGAIEPKAFRPAIGIIYKSNFSSFFTFKSSLTVARIYGNDKFNDNFERNLHFRSNVADFTAMIEWNWLPYKIGAYNRKFTPFLGIGVGGYYYNPKAELNGEWVRLQPLGTEGQGLVEYPNRTKYSLLGLSIPMSGGIKWHVNDKVGMGLSLQYRYIFNDYLDDVSTAYPDLSLYENNYVSAVAEEAIALSYRQINGNPDTATDRKRGNSEKNDAFYMIMFQLSYRLGQGHVVCPTLK